MKWILQFEQIILFYSLVFYMIGFTIIFDKEMHTSGWMGLLWLVQFFGFATLIGLRSIKKGWKWPKRY
jgi:hypothetical protein